MKISDLEFKKISHYDPFHERAKANGMVYEWVAYNEWGNSIAFGNTKKECIEVARRYCNQV